MYPRRLGAGRRGAAPSLRPVNTERAETQRHGGFQELGYTHLCNIPPDFIVLDKARRCTKREGRACRVRLRNADAAHAQVWQRPMWLRRPEYRATPQSVFAKVQGRNRRPRLFGQYDNPIISRPSSMGEAARKPTSKPISVSPSLRALRVNRPEATRCTRAAPPRSQQVATLPPSTKRHSAPGGPQFITSIHCIESFRSDSFVKRCGTLSGTACRSSL